MTTTIFHNATVFTSEPDGGVADAFAVTDGVFGSVGGLDQVRASVEGEADEVDLQGRFVAPGFIDSHVHIHGLGTSLRGVQLRDCSTLAQIQSRLVDWRAAHPDEPRVIGSGWFFSAVDGGAPTAAMIDEVLPDVPVYLEANDFHSTWVNAAALAEAGVGPDTADPIGGAIARDAEGNPTGMLYETAGMLYGRDYASGLQSADDHRDAVEAAFRAYLRSGVTGATDMALSDIEIAALRGVLARDGRLPFPLTGHVLLIAHDDPAQNLAQVDRVVALRDELESTGESAWFSVGGVKIIMDGVIDACTAAMRRPYADGSNAEPIWSAERLTPVALAADAAGLQIAVHAIGDRTSEIAVDILEECARSAAGPSGEPRHRLEHLETVTDRTIARMAALGIIASLQPVHSDPAIMDNWKAVLGDGRKEQGFPWQKFRDADVPIALGTDAPTAPHEALANLYIALTGGSALAPTLPPYHPERAFTRGEALRALTAGGAYAGRIDTAAGRIRRGLQANFVVLDIDLLEADPRELLDATVRATYVLGEVAYSRTATPGGGA
ncbi:amidohydrolase [Tsukamurella paurometabola]|uniref:Amidohydrolase 3 n=1 Tax=Tsukamurella paurometabola (strain ATCC 8368 / DSM 20162 / CCUG 35730 / CIP 100753 / JCM 10117 / KCTC 9821 / NBRC 16120 / NCIMB 702349 / NCTC 13040) TaxID=521096 RepID=D5UM84_TSUPD|nr:amidohydrolase [Tsukamurella paurometabola]ADG78364.1 Amidohydrolase 3 [Tsukamurella paurometabola DSM 20162]SUP31360.1 N-substituted formamide deformylase precursor [Tsukamurella paurometabola]